MLSHELKLKLATHYTQVDNLVADLVNGTILVELVQALTGERLFGTIPNPQSKEDAIANIQVLEFQMLCVYVKLL